MPSIAFGFRVSASGELLPFTTITVGDRTLSFCGRPGIHLRRALEEMERDESVSAEEIGLLYPEPSDPRD